MKFKFLASIAALALIGAGVSSAAIPDSTTGVITACRANGQLRMIDKQAGTNCYAWEAQLQWNAQGPIGATGPAGATGPQGPAGAGAVTNTYFSSGNYYFSVIQYSGNYSFTVNCPAGYTLLSGGYRMYEPGGGYPIYPLVLPMQAKPTSTSAYTVSFSEDNLPRTVAVGVDVVCAQFS